MLTEEHSRFLELDADTVKQAEVVVLFVDRHDKRTNSFIQRVFRVVISSPIRIIRAFPDSLQSVVWRKYHIFYHNCALVRNRRMCLGQRLTFVFFRRFTRLLIRWRNHRKRARYEVKSINPVLVLHAFYHFRNLRFQRLAFHHLCRHLSELWALRLPKILVFECKELEAHSWPELWYARKVNVLDCIFSQAFAL